MTADPAADAAQPHRRRPARALWVVVAVLLLGFAALGTYGVVRVAKQLSSTSLAPVRPPPLLPEAPALQRPTRPPAATVPPTGFDVSHPQCGAALPKGGGFGIVGVSGGKPLSGNPCLATQLSWATAKAGHAVYVNSGYRGSGDPVAYGRAAVDDAVARERGAGLGGTAMWWLDVETANTWDGTTRQNATVLDAMAARLQELGARVGIYSTPSMWLEIAGEWEPGLPIWYATGPGSQSAAAAGCATSFAGSPAAIVQWVQTDTDGELDHNLVCPAYRDRAAEIFDLG